MPRQAGLCCVRQADQRSYREASKKHSFVVTASVPTCGFLAKLLSWFPFMMDSNLEDTINLVLPKLSLVTVFIDAQDNEMILDSERHLCLVSVYLLPSRSGTCSCDSCSDGSSFLPWLRNTVKAIWDCLMWTSENFCFHVKDWGHQRKKPRLV